MQGCLETSQPGSTEIRHAARLRGCNWEGSLKAEMGSDLWGSRRSGIWEVYTHIPGGKPVPGFTFGIAQPLL